MKKHNQKQQLEAEKKELAEIARLNDVALKKAKAHVNPYPKLYFAEEPEIMREPNNPEKGCYVTAWVWIPDPNEE